MVELELDGDGDSRRSSNKSSVVTSVGGMCPLIVSKNDLCSSVNGECLEFWCSFEWSGVC